MPNPFGAPEISVQEAAKKRSSNKSVILLDVREPDEYHVRIQGDDVVYLPLSELAARQLGAIPDELADKAQEIIAFCHRGMRSAQVTAFLKQAGWTNIINMDGGIDAWAQEIDPSIGTY